MRKLFLLLLLAGLGYWAWRHYLAPGETRLTLPRVAAWRQVSSGADRYRASVAILDDRWRLEARVAGNRVVAVFDGTRFASNLPGTTAQQLDPKIPLQKLYEMLPSREALSTKPVERLGKSNCWRFESGKDAASEAWIDSRTGFVCKVSTRVSGLEGTDTFELLPVDVERQALRLFDTRNLEFVLSQ